MKDIDRLQLEQIRSCLTKSSFPTHDIPLQWTEQDCRSAGVLIPLLRNEEQWHVLYIRRASHDQDMHSGQVAFAGGKQEDVDSDLQATALREAYEEVGIQPQDVTVLGELNHHHSISRFRITPVVAQIPWPYPLILDPTEVARAFTIPLQWLANPSNYRIEKRSLAGGQAIPVIYFDEYDGEVLWGATARMTLSLLECLVYAE